MTATSRKQMTGLIDDPANVGMYPDAALIAGYMRRYPHRPAPLFCSIGEPAFTEAVMPDRLRGLLRQAPIELLGYQPGLGGYPQARRTIRDYLIRDGHLDRTGARLGRDFQIALSAGGTRGVMLDWAEHVLADDRQRRPGDRRHPVALTVAPSWDYAGVVTRAGYQLAALPLSVADGWLPNLDRLAALLDQFDADPRRRLALVIINAQHNPTGRSWPAETVTALIDTAARRGAALLLDDPYYALHTGPDPVSAPALLLDYLAAADTGLARRWLAVRSLGKQLAANGLGVGAMTTHPDVLPALLARGFARHFPAGAAPQWAVARFLTEPGFTTWMAGQQESLGRKRRATAAALTRLGVSEHLVPVGEATPYMLLPVPPRWSGNVERYRRWLLDTAGVLLAPASIEDPALQGDQPAVRLYLGSSEHVVDDLLARLTAAGLGWPAQQRAGSRVGN